MTLLVSRLSVLQPARVFYLFTPTTAGTPPEAGLKPPAQPQEAELSGNAASGSLQGEESEESAGTHMDKEAGAKEAGGAGVTGGKEAGATESKEAGVREAGGQEAEEAQTASVADASSPPSAPSSGPLGGGSPGPGGGEGSDAGVDQVRRLVSSLQEDLPPSAQTPWSGLGPPAGPLNAAPSAAES